jgi:hypothetical protein
MKQLFKSVIIILLTFMFSQCGQEENIQTNALSDIDVKNIASTHNEALNQVFLGLKKQKTTGQLNSTSFQKTLNSELTDFYSKHYAGENDFQKSADYFSQNEVSKYMNNSSGPVYRTKSGLTPIESVIEEYKTYLSVQQIQLLRRCDKTLANSLEDSESTIKELDAIQVSAKQSLSQQDAQLIIIGTEIGKASISYWKANFNDWQELIAPSNAQGRTSGWFSGGEVAGADVAGGVGGAVGAAVVNVIPGAGQVAYGGAILGGAAGASAADAVMQVWNHFF